jgi:hypothetical protein
MFRRVLESKMLRRIFHQVLSCYLLHSKDCVYCLVGQNLRGHALHCQMTPVCMHMKVKVKVK